MKYNNWIAFEAWTKCLLLCAVFVLACLGQATAEFAKADGYQGIWYSNQPTKDEYVYKYSGGLGTYCMKHIPMAIYAPEVNKTFFVYGGAGPENHLLEMVSYYDHASKKVPRPTILIDKKTDDAHDNPVIALDAKGYVWVFASSHGTARPSYIFQSKKPYDIDDFDMVLETNFSYPQPWYVPGRGFLFLHTRYKDGRGLCTMTSADGHTWTDPVPLAHIGEGHYQVSWPHEDKVGTAFDYHPKGRGLNFRTNLYYMETGDFGETWKAVTGETLPTPLASVQNPALVHDYEAEGLLVYVKDLNYDTEGKPIILYVTSKGWQPGPENGPHAWHVAKWQQGSWSITDVTESDNNYDSGSLYTEEKGLWRIIGPTEPGPQRYNPGGEIALWTSEDEGASWSLARRVTTGSRYNHTYVRRPVNAQPDFYAFWADGDGRKRSDSRLYFCDINGENVRVLPASMKEDNETPIPLYSAEPGRAEDSR